MMAIPDGYLPIFDDPNDENNFNFLMNVSAEVLADWYSKMSDDDINYADSLLETARLEILDRSINLDYTESSLILSQIK